jgi:hypothetical protein
MRASVKSLSPPAERPSLPSMLEAAWAHARPGREAAAQNEVLRAFQPCPLSGKPDIELTPPNDRV